MLKICKKYFIVTLSAMLILSNFSFAVTYSLCSMGEMKQSCGKINKSLDGFGISKERSSCCMDRISELSNSNILSQVYSSSNDCIQKTFSYIDISSIIEYNFSQIIYSNCPDKIPKDGIPVINLSLLI